MATSTNFNPNTQKPLSNEMKSYINLGQYGHYPLFFKEWIKDGLDIKEPLSYRVANRNVREVFKKLAKHRTEEKKKILISSFNDEERNIFIKSFVKVVEHNVLKDMKTLH